MIDTRASIGVVGAGPIGTGLTHNLVRHDFTVVLHSRSPKRPADAKAGAPVPELVTVAPSIHALAKQLKPPRVIVSAVSDSGTPEVLKALSEVLAKGDVVIDVSNAGSAETAERQDVFEDRKLSLLAGGLASGEHGATHGISITVSGSATGYKLVQPVLETVATAVDKKPCVQYLGEGSSSHLVKTIHNGLEYSIMQLLAEIIVVLRDLCGMAPLEIASTLREWNTTIGSCLIDVAIDATLLRVSPNGNTPAIDCVEDRVDHNGSGARAAVHALSGNIFNPSAALSILARLSSDRGNVRSQRQSSPHTTTAVLASDDARSAFFSAMHILYVDTFEHLRAAAEHENNCFTPQQVWDTWRGATIASSFHAMIPCGPQGTHGERAVDSRWRAVLVAATERGVGLPLLSGLLNFNLAQHSARSYASVLQIMRNRLGGSSFVLVQNSPTKER